MLEILEGARNLRRTVALVAVGCVLAVAAGLLGLSDNPPGILLALAAIAALIVAFVHHWRTARQFKLLAYAAGLGFGFFAIVHNVFEALAGVSGEVAAVQVTLQGLGVAAFLIAILVCPPALVVGVVGACAMWIRSRVRTDAGTPS